MVVVTHWALCTNGITNGAKTMWWLSEKQTLLERLGTTIITATNRTLLKKGSTYRILTAQWININ